MDLIAMSTHGRSGLTRWILGSVADRVSRGTRLPVLLVRPPGLAEDPFPPQPEIEL
jgi:nucleotide-binding universal stress UspA family protein